MSLELYALIGQKQAALEAAEARYGALLDELAHVLTGDVDRSRLLVNLTDRTWSRAPLGETVAMPATINGLPKCAVAPAPEPAPEGVATLHRNGDGAMQILIDGKPVED